MCDDATWKPLLDELGRWQRAGRVATLWLRDDDAVEPTAALERLLTLTALHVVPTTLAVIPAFTGEALAHRLHPAAQVEVAVHGWSHENFAPVGEKKQELGAHRPADAVLASLEEGVAHLRHLHGPRFVPVLVPPWNRIDPKLIPWLGGIGYSALSVFGPERDLGLPAINTHVDVMDWRGTRGGRDTGDLVAEMVARLRVMETGGGTLGLLTHHLVHDEAVWIFLEALFERTARHPACRWTKLSTIVAGLRVLKTQQSS
ncbi:polysaccharide deacetylase family protein [Rhizobium sp. ARZ01]|uniref:polysaccharide deacetylase family protein n=1 Tax=Rhizobium sp. ARZ01 TaxID=2769313 RepID=UPI001781A04A|nr:polysaccharide deacetylase family protein [Rhizobium sp. ARZ01]MBD9371506.1 polysaccharide deacetylase family protein [Rhizobium sp. ARZ01]